MLYRGEGGVVDPSDRLRLKHFARWINGRIYKTCSFDKYRPWIEAQDQPMLLAA